MAKQSAIAQRWWTIQKDIDSPNSSSAIDFNKINILKTITFDMIGMYN